IAATMIGILIDWTAQVVELLLEQSSKPSSELVDRIALALRNDLKLKTFVPVSKARLALAMLGSGTATLFTTCVETVPSFFNNFSGRAVLMSSEMLGSMAIRMPSPPAPAPGLPPAGMMAMSSSGYG